MAIFYSSYFIICAQKRLYEKVLPDTLGKGWKSVAILQILREIIMIVLWKFINFRALFYCSVCVLSHSVVSDSLQPHEL